MSRAALAAAFACLVCVPFLGQAFHVDEPMFLAVARQILRSPLHPLSFSFDWDGGRGPIERFLDNPLGFPYLLAAVSALSGEREWLTRALLLPLNAAAGAALYLLAARFLRRPLWAVVAVLACPALAINLGHAMPERLAAALGFCSIYAGVRGVDEDDARWQAAAAALLAGATLSKYLAALFVVPLAAYALARVRRPARFLALLGAALVPLVVNLAVDRATFAAGARAIGGAAPAHQARALLALLGGGGVSVAVWPFLRRGSTRLFAACSAAALLLYSPLLDGAAPPRWIDRLEGAALGAGALACLVLVAARPSKGRPLWAAWALSFCVVETFLYWSLSERILLFALPPLVFSLAEALEADGRAGKKLYAATAAGALTLSLALGAADARYADAQRDVAARAAAEAAPGKLWFAGTWGLQHYCENAGGAPVVWEEVKPGDLVIVPRVNVRPPPPVRPLPASERLESVDFALPVRLIGDFDERRGVFERAGFYSSRWGFLPFVLSSRPVDQFTVARAL